MYTRLAKGILKALTVLGVIAALIIGGSVGANSDNFTAGFLAFILALLGIGLLLLFFGMFVELTNNVMDIKIYLQDHSVPNKMESAIEKWDSFDSAGDGMTGNSTSIKTWTCHRCGVTNKEEEKVCEGCGYTRYASANQEKKPSLETVAAEVTKERMKKTASKELHADEKKTENREEPKDWFCTACGEKNRPQARFCAKCGKKKSM